MKNNRLEKTKEADGVVVEFLSESFQKDVDGKAESGTKKWFEANLLPHENTLRAWLLRNFKVHGEVDDIIQDSYVRTLQVYTKHAKKIDNPKAYLFSVARNLSYRVLKKTEKTTPTAFDEATNTEEVDSGRSIEEWMQYREDLELLNEAIRKLPNQCRQIFVMRRIRGMSSAEISKKLGISVHTVSSQLTIGLEKCAKFFKQHQQSLDGK